MKSLNDIALLEGCVHCRAYSKMRVSDTGHPATLTRDERDEKGDPMGPVTRMSAWRSTISNKNG